jgi:putative Mg2+ transporter-C (MgtC) family protein
MISEVQIILRILVAMGLGALIGWERERRGQPAGLRTHIILCIGSALAMILSINLAYPNNDPARLAAQVITGIGFLGAGAIFRYGTGVKGLTTATSLWTMGIIGLACGMGMFLVAAGTTILLLFVLYWVEKLEIRYIHQAVNFNVVVVAANRKGLLKDLKKILSEPPRSISSTQITRDMVEDVVEITFNIRSTDEDQADDLVSRLSAVKNIKKIEIS